MNADLLARYGRRFIDSARERLAASAGQPRTLALHLHSISGEAAMMGLAELSQLARDVMRTARAVETEPERAAECATELARLTRALEDLEARLPR